MPVTEEHLGLKPQGANEIEILKISFKHLVDEAKRLGQKEVIWQHPMSKELDVYAKSLNVEVVGMPYQARYGDQWIVKLS